MFYCALYVPTSSIDYTDNWLDRPACAYMTFIRAKYVIDVFKYAHIILLQEMK